ncbi:Hsp20/alpha crystallin family protein [candidate division WOR-3 bacterium]|nr:Hsp20/alpha crystallin family protein [candidate division WOR-3 bacterium]
MKSHFFYIDAEKFMRGAEETYPLVDFLLTEDEVCILAEVPGIPKESLEVTVTAEHVEIRGKKKEPESFANATHFYKLESFYGCFRRRITLPVKVETEYIKTSLVDGILDIRIPRSRRRIIEIPVD